MALRTGIQQAREADKKRKPVFDRPDFFKLENDGDRAVLRYLLDGHKWPYVDSHSFAPTRGPAKEWDDEKRSKYPVRNGAVCRKDELFEGEHDDCFICDHMTKDNGKPYRPSVRVWALAVVRKPVVGTQKMVEAGKIKEHRVGKVVAYVDEIIEVDERDATGKETGKKIKRPHIVVVNFGMKNFFTALTGYYQAFEGTVTNRDFLHVRDGSGTDTNYVITALDPTPGFDTSDPETRAKYEPFMPDLEQLIRDRASDDYFAYFFDTRVPHPERKGKDDEGDDEEKPKAKTRATTPKAAAADPVPESKPDNGVSADRLAAMSKDVRGRYGRKNKETPAEEPPPAAAEEHDESDEDTTSAAPDVDESETDDVDFNEMAFTG